MRDSLARRETAWQGERQPTVECITIIQGERQPGKVTDSLARWETAWQGERQPGKVRGSLARWETANSRMHYHHSAIHSLVARVSCGSWVVTSLAISCTHCRLLHRLLWLRLGMLNLFFVKFELHLCTRLQMTSPNPCHLFHTPIYSVVYIVQASACWLATLCTAVATSLRLVGVFLTWPLQQWTLI